MSKSSTINTATSTANDGAPLTHLNERGEANMVDVSAKQITQRLARAYGFVAMAAPTLALIETGQAKKGDVLATARIAGIMAAKKTSDLIPLCHPLAITKATIEFELSHDPVGIHVTSLVKVSGQTGVEMEALTAVSVACLTIYDMLKAADKAMSFRQISLLEKSGGRSGHYRAASDDVSSGMALSNVAAPSPHHVDSQAKAAPPPKTKAKAKTKTTIASKPEAATDTNIDNATAAPPWDV